MSSNYIQLEREKLNRLNDRVGSNADSTRLLINFLNFVEENPSTTYYHISRIMEASKCDNPIQALNVASYFCSPEHNLLFITFCYFDYDGEEIEVDHESYIDSLRNGTPPYSVDTGNPIEDFNRARLGFYCYINPEVFNGI